MSSKVIERRDWWKNFVRNDGRLLWPIFLNICKNNVRLLGSEVAKVRKLLLQQLTYASNIVTDCQKIRFPSFISRPYNSRRLKLRLKCVKNNACRSCSTHQLFSIFHQNSQVTHVNIGDLLLIICAKIVDIDQYLLKSFENNGLVFFEPQCISLDVSMITRAWETNVAEQS